MSAAGISSNSLFYENQTGYQNQTIQNNLQQVQQEFQQLGEDLESGNLSAAQSDFATLQQLSPQSSATNTTTSTENSNPIAQAFNQLSQDLQAGNLTAAQQDYANIQQDFQNLSQNQTGQTETGQTQAGQTQGHHHHHHGGGSSQSEISQLFEQLGQDLQSGNLSTAQQTYNSLVQDLPLGQPGAQVEAESPSVNGVSVSA
jgi:outer membrane protein assembly factor BamD (BamD/ComL family)